jgi:YebC/PmpR family DNA-binding regulatory protein
MAGHSQFKNIMFRKGAQDKKRAKIFTKIIRELTVAAREGLADPDSNPRLRSAIIAARDANMPRDTMDRAIKRGSGELDGESYELVRYEGRGPGGVALIVEALTDNRNRTASAVRAAFSKFGGTLGADGSVSFLFNRQGTIHYAAKAASADQMLEAAIEAGAEDCVTDAKGHDVVTTPETFHQVKAALETKFGAPESAEVAWQPQNTVQVKDDQAETLVKLLTALDDDDDVQNVFGNYEVSDELMSRLSA